MNLPAVDQGAGLIQAQGAVQLALDAAACFAAGVSIAAAKGDVPVEELCVGDRLRLLSGDETPAIQWIGRRWVDCRRHPRPKVVWPIRVSANAFAPGRPHRDLLLSPDHAVYVLGVLIPVKSLTNTTTIVRMTVDEVTYYHVELANHDIILANGLPVESYLSSGDRSDFGNGGGTMRLFPDFATRSSDVAALWEAAGRAPLMIRGPKVQAARNLLNARAALMTAA
jgi:hypothetical protein